MRISSFGNGASASNNKMPEGRRAAAAASAGVRRIVELVDGSYSNRAGTLTYKLYRPATLRKRPPLFVMLHGGSQSAADFAIGTRMNELADECGGIVLYPEQSKGANLLGCWNWYHTRHQFADDGEPSMIAGMTRKVMADHGVDPKRVYVAGMSAGGAMAVILGRAYPDLYAAVGVHSGVPSGVAHDLMSALQTMNSGPIRHHAAASAGVDGHSVATIVFHGDCDTTVQPLNGEAVLAQALRSAAFPSAPAPTAEPIEATGGRAVTRVTQAKPRGLPLGELWLVHGGGHAWTGGSPKGSFTDEKGPDASREMLRFFLQRRLSTRAAFRKAA